MSSLDQNELFEQYYQKEYDFNTESLTPDEVGWIKKLVREKRVDYAIAPMGTGIFDWILRQDSNIRFELVEFDSEAIDGMLYIPITGKERAYIILNANKPLINQIFTAAHEFYHYIADYKIFRKAPYVCNFNALKDVKEKKACRFAAELLLPEEALLREVSNYCTGRHIKDVKSMGFIQFSSFVIYMTIKYQIPLKAVIYRLLEEGYIRSEKKYIENCDFIMGIIRETKVYMGQVSELYNTKNDYVLTYGYTYQDMEKAFISGFATKENIIKDARILNMDMSLIDGIVSDNDTYDEVEDKDDEYCADVIKRHKLPYTLSEYIKESLNYF